MIKAPSPQTLYVIGSDLVFSQLLTLVRIKKPEGLDSHSSFCSYPLVTGFSSMISAGMWQVGFMGRLCSTLKQDVCTLTSVSHLMLLWLFWVIPFILGLMSPCSVALCPIPTRQGGSACHKTADVLWGCFRKTPEGVGSAGLDLVPSCPRGHIRGEAPSFRHRIVAFPILAFLLVVNTLY